MKKPDKLPTLDPTQPGIYRRIIDTARAVRAQQQCAVAIIEAQRRARLIAELALIGKREAVEEAAE